jgi:GAF domain-containing protein
MSATLHKDAVHSARRAHSAQSFGKLAELVRRYLDCEAAVLSLDDPFGGPRRARSAGARCASAAFRRGQEARDIDVQTLTNPLIASSRGMRFYAGLPLQDHRGRAIGMLAAMDQHERALAPKELETLKRLASLASDLYEMQRLGRAA